MNVSIIIPALNEADHIASAIRTALAAEWYIGQLDNDFVRETFANAGNTRSAATVVIRSINTAGISNIKVGASSRATVVEPVEPWLKDEHFTVTVTRKTKRCLVPIWPGLSDAGGPYIFTCPNPQVTAIARKVGNPVIFTQLPTHVAKIPFANCARLHRAHWHDKRKRNQKQSHSSHWYPP